MKLYTSKPEVVKKRVQQNAARQAMIKAGKAKVGDGKDVDHKTPISRGGTNSPSNLRVISKSSNRSFSRNSDSSIKSQTSRKERKR